MFLLLVYNYQAERSTPEDMVARVQARTVQVLYARVYVLCVTLSESQCTLVQNGENESVVKIAERACQ